MAPWPGRVRAQQEAKGNQGGGQDGRSMGLGVGDRRQTPRPEPVGPQSPQSPAGDPGMCLPPSECPQLCGEGDIEGVEGGFLSLALLPALPTGGWTFPSPTRQPRPYPNSPQPGGQGRAGSGLSLKQGGAAVWGSRESRAAAG